MPPDNQTLSNLTPTELSYAQRLNRMAARHPRSARLYSVVNRSLFRTTGGRFGGRMKGVPIGLLTTTGRRTGRTRTVPVVYLEEPARYLVVASNSGLDSPPAWLLNLLSEPNGELQTRNGREPVVGRGLSDAESQEVWPRLAQHNKMWAAYQCCTERPLAVIALERQ